jgi:hypothetical protein
MYPGGAMMTNRMFRPCVHWLDGDAEGPVVVAKSFERFSRRNGKSLAATPRFYEALLRRSWPGNVRQLKSVGQFRNCLPRGSRA